MASRGGDLKMFNGSARSVKCRRYSTRAAADAFENVCSSGLQVGDLERGL